MSENVMKPDKDQMGQGLRMFVEDVNTMKEYGGDIDLFDPKLSCEGTSNDETRNS